MADSDKDILITPQTSQVTDPSIVFSSGATSGDDVTLFVTDDGTITTLSFEGSAGQLLSISNDLTGTIFSVNDISGIPSIEVDADGTISLAEFDGEVGIGTAAPTEMLHIEGRDVASSNAAILIQARGDARIDLIADTVSDAETNNPYITFSQDGAAVLANIGTVGAANIDAHGNTFTGAANNGLSIHHRYATGEINLGVNGQVGLTVDDNNRVYIGQDSIGYFTAVTGDYGSVQATGAEGSAGTWHGFSIGGRSVFMDNAGSATTNRFGLYDDINNLWAIQYNTGALGNSELSLYYNGAVKMVTTNTGVSVTGTMAATTVTGALNAGDITTGTLPVLRGGTGVTTSTGTGNTVLSASPTFTGTVNMSTLNAGNIDSSGTITASSRFTTDSGDGKGLGFWGGAATTYGHYMSQAATQGRITGETTSDYNQYFEMNSGTNRGFVFETDGTKLFAINPDGVRSTGSLFATSQIQAPAGFIGTYDDAASSAWGGPIWGMDDGYTGPVGGANALATSCYGMRWNRGSSTQATTYIGEGLYVYTNGVIEGGIGTSGTYSVGPVTTSQLRSTSTLTLSTNTSENAIVCSNNAQVSLYHDNGLEFRTQQHEGGGITSGAEVYDHGGVLRDVGFNTLDTKKTNVSDTLEATDCGGAYIKTVSTAYTISLPSATTTAGQDFPVDGVVTVFNAFTSGNYTINASVYTRTLYWLDGSTRTGGASTNRTVGPGGIATIWRQSSTTYYIWGSGIS